MEMDLLKNRPSCQYFLQIVKCTWERKMLFYRIAAPYTNKRIQVQSGFKFGGRRG